jgi:hypothetical protein
MRLFRIFVLKVLLNEFTATTTVIAVVIDIRSYAAASDTRWPGLEDLTGLRLAKT